MKTNAPYFVFLLTLLTFTQADLIQPLTRTPVRPFSINQGYTTDYSFSFYLPSTIPVNGYIEVEFPQPYQLPSNCQAYINIGSTYYTAYPCSKTSYSVYLITMGSIEPGDYTVVFVDIKNPSNYPASSNFKIKTYLNKVVLVDSNEFFDSVPFLAYPETSRNSSIKNIGYTTVSLGSSYDFTFALQTPLSAGDSIKFNFADGFYFVKPACFHRNSGTYTQMEVLYNNRTVICQAFLVDLATDVYHVVSIIGVVNPVYAGVFRNFYLETLEDTSAHVYERIAVPNYVQIFAGNITLIIDSASNLLSLNTTHQFTFTMENDVPEEGEVWIRIPPGFRYLAANCTLLRPIDPQPGKVVTCELAANYTGYIIRNFAGISASQTITVKTVTENPSAAASYKIEVFSYSTKYRAMIDYTSGYITIIGQYGASKMYESHSLLWTRRLKHNEPGPMEFTFFLNIPLPATASTFYGKVIVDIRPKILIPAAPKQLACFFYKTIPAEDCIWDTSTYTDRTRVTIMTPVTDPYWQSEIPITVTTTDSVGDYGILLPYLIQRYKFYFYFWRNGDAVEHEVYFDDYVPEPIDLANTGVTLTIAPLQYNQEAYLELVWTNNYYGLGTNYFIELEFNNGAPGWDYNLGWPTLALGVYDWYNMPCLVDYLGSDYKCYLLPGGSSSTNSTIRIIGLSAIALNNIATIRLPKIKFGLSGAANVRFTVYENTPGEKTLKIPIVYNDFFLTPNAATGLTTSAFSVTLSTDKPDVDSTLDFLFTPSVTSPRFTIYQYPSLFVIATQKEACSSNECYVFTSSQVQWIVFDARSNPQGNSVSTSLTIHNPPYIGSYPFYARTELNGPIEDWRQQSVTINPGPLTVTFTTYSTNPPEFNKNSLLLFDIATTTITNIPLDGSVTLTFTGLTVPDGDNFSCQAVTGLTGQSTAVSVICEKSSASVIRLYNIQHVPAGTAFRFIVQLWTGTTTMNVNCLVQTFYDRIATSTKLIDTGNKNLLLTLVHDNFQSSMIINDRSGDIVRAGSYGAFTFSITPSHTPVSTATMTITFGTGFALSTGSAGNDVPYCKLNNVRRRCYFTSTSPVTFSIPSLTSTYITAGVPVTVFLTTDYSDPTVKGIQAPSTPGYNYVTFGISGSYSALPTPISYSETNGQYVYVYPATIPQFTVAGTCTSADYYTMFIVQFTLTQSLKSNTDITTRGRIYIEFPTGTGGFRDDLGTGQATGGVVGCRVENPSLVTTIKCRLVQSPGNGLPAAVELVGFGAITAATTGATFKVTIARVKNAQQTVGENVFGLRVEEVDVATGTITPKEYATYNLWHRVYTTPAPVANLDTPPDVTFGNTVSGTSLNNPYPNNSGVTMIPTIYTSVALAASTTTPDYYIYELPSDFLVSNTVTCPTSTSPTTPPSTISSSICYSFPEIGWVVYQIANGGTVAASTSSSTDYPDGSISTVTMPGGYSYLGYTFKAYVWKANVFYEYVTFTIQHSWLTSNTAGTFTSRSITTFTDQLVMNRKTEITVSFNTYSQIPSTGTIEIRFTSGITPLPNCKNAPSMGSVLTSSTGRIACTVQSNSWLITNFDAVSAGVNIQIYGFITLPSSVSNPYYIKLFSYSNQDSTNIAINGNLIDSYTGTGLSITVQNQNTLALDLTPSITINKPIIAQSSNFRPFIFAFTLNGLSLTMANGAIKITVLAANFPSTIPTNLPTGASRICSFMTSAGAYIACEITSVTTSVDLLSITYSLNPKQTLAANTAYTGTITSVFGQDGVDGIQQPSTAGTYQVSIEATDGTTKQRDIDFYEIVPSTFTSLTVKNYVISPSDEDVIDVSLTVGTAIGTSDRLVVEFPTLYNSSTLFANDLGLGLIDAEDKLCEVISSTPSITMSCFFQLGNRYAGTSASIVLHGFSASFTALRFAFTITNPAVTSPTVLPLTIYTLSGSTPPFVKTYYQSVERAIVVLSSVTTPAPSTSTQPSYSSRTVDAATGVSLSIVLSYSSALQATDYYVIKTPQMGAAATASTTTITINSINTDVIILPKNQYIILNPDSALSSGYTASIGGLINPAHGLVGSAGLSFSGYVAHFTSMTAERVTYSNNAADFTGFTSFPTTPSVSFSTVETQQYSTVTVTINANYQTIRSVIIRVLKSDLALQVDCYEAVGSAIPISECRTDVPSGSYGYVYVTLEDKTYTSSNQDLKLTVLAQNGATASTVSFNYYLYTTVETDPTNLLGQRYAVLSSPAMTLTTTGTNAPSPTLLEAEYVPYVENNVHYPVSTYGDLKFKLTLPSGVSLTTSNTFKLLLPSILTFDTTTVTGDLTSTPAVILSSSSGYSLVTATYSSGTLSFPSAAVSSGDTITFTVTSMKKTGELIGISLPNIYSNTESSVILEILSGSTVTYTAQIGDMVLSEQQTFSVTLLPLTKAGSQVTAWEFTINSLTASIDSFYIDFPTVDDYGNTLFASGLGVFSDEDIVPCSSPSKLSTLTTPECIFFAGSSSKPASIRVRGFQQTGTMVLYIAGAKNPATGTRIYMNIRFYVGTNFNSMSRVLGYLTESNSFTSPNPSDSTYYVDDYDGSTYTPGTYAFRTPITIPSSTLILVKLDSTCLYGKLSSDQTQHFLSGTIGGTTANYVLMKTTTQKGPSSPSSVVAYSFTNFRCTKMNGLVFTEYNMGADSGGVATGEIRTGTYTPTAITISNGLARVSTTMLSETGLAKFEFDITGLNSYFIFNSQSLISPSFTITITFQNYYFASVTGCQVFGGLELMSPNTPIGCSTSGLVLTISKFIRIIGTLKLQIDYNMVSSASYSSPQAIINIYDGSTSLISPYSISLSVTSNPPSSSIKITPSQAPYFNTVPYPGQSTGSSGTMLQFNAVSLPSSYTPTVGHYLRIGIERGILSASFSTCYLSSNPSYYTGCSVSTATSGDYDYLMISMGSASAISTLPFTYIIFTYPNWPVDARDLFYEYAVVDSSNIYSYNYKYCSNSITDPITGQGNALSSATALHNTPNLVNEIYFSISTPIALDSTMIVSFQSSDMTVRSGNANSLTQIDCQCTATATCYYYKVGTTTSIDAVVTSSIGAGGSVACYVPDITVTTTAGTLTHKIIDASSREAYFSTTVGISLSTTTYGTHSLSVTYPSAPILPYTTSYTSTVEINGPAYSAGSLAYVDFGAGGPIYSCPGSGICRYYSTVRNILVMEIPSGSGTTSDLFSGSVTFSPRVTSITANYTMFSYIIASSGGAVTSQQSATSTLSPSNFSPEKTAVTLTVDELRQGLLARQKLSFLTQTNAIPGVTNSVGGRIKITVTGVTGVNTVCFASYSNIPITCSLSFSGSTSTITLTRTSGIPAGVTVEVSFLGNNPTSGTPTISLTGYSDYNYDVQILASGTVTYPGYTSNAGAYVPISQVSRFSLITKTINPSYAPIRVKFELTSAMVTSTNRITLSLPASEYSYNNAGNVIGYLRTYSTDFDFTQQEVSSITVSGSVSGSTTTPTSIAVTLATTLTANKLYELIIITDLLTTTPAPHFARLSSNGKQLTATFDNSGTSTIYAKQTINLYQYQSTPVVKTSGFYYTSNYANDANVLIFTLTLSSAITAFPYSMLELELTSASSALIKSGFTSASRELPCGIAGLSVRSSSVDLAPKCVLVQSTTPKIRIENYAALSTGTFNVIIYDILNTIIPKDAVGYFDAVLTYTDYTTASAVSMSREKLTRAFTVNTGTASASTTSIGTLTASPSTYATVSTLSGTLPSGNSCTTCRLVVKSSGWDWTFTDTSSFKFKIDNVDQTILLDRMNNAFVVLSTNPTTALDNSLSHTFSFSGTAFKSPSFYPNNVNTNIFTIQEVSNNQYKRAMTSSLPSLTPETFTGTTSSCSVINNLYTGANGGNVDCYLTIPVSSSLVSDIEAVRIDFTTSSQYSAIHSYCKAYISGSTTPGGQLTCSRIDSAANSASILVSGFGFTTGSTLYVYFRARVLTNSLTTDIYLQVLDGTTYYSVHKQASYSIGLTSAVSTTASQNTAPTLFQVQTFTPTRLDFSTPSPFRIITQIPSGITAASSGYIQVALGSSLTLNGLTVPQCSLRLQSSYGRPIITPCTYTSGTFTLTPLVDVTSGRYLITIGSLQSELATDGVTFPSNTNRVSTKVTVYSGSATAIDMDYLAMIASPFYGISISPQRNLVGATSSEFELNVQPSSSTATVADITSSGGNELILVLEFPTPLYDSDLGASTVTFTADGIPYYNGIFVPSIIPSGLGGIATFHFGSSTQSAYIIISKHSGFPTSSQTISLGLIKNPAANTPLQMNMYLLSYPSSQQYATVLFQASYVNYYFTVQTAGETGTTPLFYLSNPYTQQTTDLILYTKSYSPSSVTISTSSKIYVKLKNAALGFAYSSITSITCSGYTVQWLKTGYIFYLIPSTSIVTNPTITCTGFTLGNTIEAITVETGIHTSDNNGKYIYASTQSITTSVLTSIPNSVTTPISVSAAISPGLDNRESVSKYLISVNTKSTVNSQSYKLKAGGYLLFDLQGGLEAVAGLSEYIYVSGLTDDTSASPPTSIQATIVTVGSNSGIKITGYDDFVGTMTFTLFLRNINAGSNQIVLYAYDTQGAPVVKLTLPAITITSADYSTAASITSFLTDTVDVFATENFRMTFELEVKNDLKYSTSSDFQIALPTGFTLASGYEICKYRLSTSSNWIRSACTVSSQTLTIPLVDGFNVLAGEIVYVQLTTENALYTSTGMVRPTITNTIYNFTIMTHISGSEDEAVYLPFILYPDPTDVPFTAIWYTRGASDSSVIEISFTETVNLNADEFFQIDFETDDEITNVFSSNLGTGATEKRSLGNCAEYPNYHVISSSNIQLQCYIQLGVYSTTSTSYPARLIVRNELAITGSATTKVRFYLANIKNPGSIPGGFVISVMTPCRNDGYGCPRHRLRDFKYFGTSSPKDPSYISNRAAPDSSVPLLLQDDSLTTFTFKLDNNVSPTEAIVVITNTVNIIITDVCTTGGSDMCIHFPAIGWTFYQPASTLAASNSASIAFKITNAQYYDRTNPYDLKIEPMSSSGIQQIIYSRHPDYTVYVPDLTTFPTQTDPNRMYIVTNFNNYLEMSMDGIWRAEEVRRIIVNTPSSYIPINSSYCRAGVDLADISQTTYIEFPCQITGPREITIIINEPTRWTSAYASKSVTVYFHGWLWLDWATGQTTDSIITSYCSYTQPYVLDENTYYNFTISATPTPIIREVELNLASFYDRTPGILDYVLFYTAVWPNTPFTASDPIAELVFELADEYAYPPLANLVCVTKDVWRKPVSCTLKRSQGRTLIYVTPPRYTWTLPFPGYYKNTPFLLWITNTAENLLFTAPDREGSFLFNVTYLDAAGNMIESANSYMGVDGGYVTVFNAVPLREDPDVQTLYDITFTTASRVTPMGFIQAGQSVYTQLVLLFQTYDPAFPIDLGTGLADGSDMSCIAVTGLTFTGENKLTCQLVYGLPTDHSKVIITGYDAIPAGTSVRIFIDNIVTMPIGVSSRIQLQIQSTYTDTGDTFLFYNSLGVSPDVPTASTAATNNNWDVSRATGASSVLRARSTYTVYFKLTSPMYSGDYLIFDFPEYGYELDSDYSTVVVNFQDPSYPCSSWVMPKTNRIYIQLQADLLLLNTNIYFDIINIQNPSFVLPVSGSYTFALRAIVSQKLKDNYSNTFAFTSQVCSLFSNEQIVYNSTYILMNENTYQISFTVDHDVPADGSVAIVFDANQYNLRSSNPSCQLVSGFSSVATCEFELFIEPLVRIKMNGQELYSGTSVELNVINVNNPTTNSVAATITLESFFDDDFGTTKLICSKAITLPMFNTLSLIKCPIAVEPEINNAGTTTDYIITLSCPESLRNATEIDIGFPVEFESGLSSDITCSTNGNYMLESCSLIARTTTVKILISEPSDLQALQVRIRDIQNPLSTGTYSTLNVNLIQYGVNYGVIDTTQSSTDIVIVANKNLVKSDSKLSLSIFPKNYGEKATHFFSLPGIKVKQVPTDLILEFDTAYSTILGESLECGTFTPDSTFGQSYALNYENLVNYKGFSCNVVDDYKLTFTLAPTFTITAGKTFDLFFYVQGLVNPSINSQTSYSYNFMLLDSGTLVFSSANTLSVIFALPPSLLQITSLVTTDNNILAPAIYTFTLEATTSLPASTSNSSKQYELEMVLPEALYPDFMQSVKVVYAFPDSASIQSKSSAFNYQNALFFSAEYPNLETLGAFRLTLGNMTNPSVQSYCGINAAGDAISFETQYVSRKQGYVYGRTYPIADQQNCLALGKDRDAIKVISPLYLRKGLVYTITLQVEEAASDLYLRPVAPFLIFEPKTVSFLDYQAKTVSLNVVVPSNVPEQDYTIQWKKTETGSITNYLEVPDTQVIVVDETTSVSVTPSPNVKVEAITYVWTGKVPRDVVITLDLPPAEQLIVQVKAKTTDTKLTGSADGTTFKQFPISVVFSKGESKKTFYIAAKDGAKNNVLTYTISGTNANAYNSHIADTPFAVQTQAQTTGFQVLSIQQVQIQENNASYLVSLSSIGTVYYLAVISSSMTVTQNQIVSGTLTGVDSDYYNAGSVVVQKIQYASTYSAYINITGLRSQTTYQVYFVARSVFGEYSGITKYSFTTLKVSSGAILLIPTIGNITTSSLIDALSIILPIDKSRLIVNEAEEFPAAEVDTSNQALGSQLNAYRVTIAPDSYNNTPVPQDIASQMQIQSKLDHLKALIPQFYQKSGVRVTPVERITPRVIVTPNVTLISYYDLTIHVELIEVGKLYAIVTEKTDQGNVQPTSYQISQGLMADNTQLSDRYYKIAETDANGGGDLVFDELKDYTNYNVYITASNDVPYDTADILENDEVMYLEVQTLKNPNIGSAVEATKLYDQLYSSASRELGLLWGMIVMLVISILM